MTVLLGTWDVDAYARTARLRGAASAFNLRGDTRWEYSPGASATQADLDALAGDWAAVGNDLALVMAPITGEVSAADGD